jgi:hypothetical protein
MSAGSITLLTFGSLFFGGLAGGLYWMVVSALGQAAELGCILGILFLATLVTGAAMFKTWYYNARLMCIRHDQCSAGTVVDEPTVSTDGDRKINLLLAPFSVEETEQLMVETLDSMRGTLSNVPALIDLQNRQIRFDYVRGLSDADQQRVHADLIDNRMFGQPGRAFLRHYYRRDEARMGTPAFNESPDDTAIPSNPMFRYDGPILVPYMHNEVDGYILGKFLDNLLVALVTALVAYTALCALCATVGLPDALCGAGAAALAALLALLALILATAINPPADGDASEVDVDVEDPDFDAPPTEMRRGDVVFVFGNWIMDEEHENYFEIHPVKAWHLLCQRGGADPNNWVLSDDIPRSECAVDVRLMTEADFERLCGMVKDAETNDPDDVILLSVPTGLTTIPPRPEP